MTALLRRPARAARAIVAVAALAVAALALLAGCGTGAAPTSPAAPSPSAVAASGSAVPAEPQPPVALLAIDARPGVAGSLGTYTFRGAGSDAPWLPGAALPVGAGGTARVELVPDVGVGTWRVKRAPPGDTDGAAARLVASGSGPIAFPIDAGAGTILVDVEFADGQGSAAWFWRVVPG